MRQGQELVRKSATIFGLLTISLTGFANLAYSPVYEDGKVFCDRISASRATEIYNGFLPVPVDYRDPSKGTTDLYFSTSRKFDPTLPTMIFFSGGPGGASHYQGHKQWQELNSLRVNIIQFDQRGIACSRPATEVVYMDSQFYSSENTARDADELRKLFNVDKVSVYGLSYGTVPATIYASLFESSTKSLILEGVVYSGMDYEERGKPGSLLEGIWGRPHFEKG
jgi:proline iminopeptidase